MSKPNERPPLRVLNFYEKGPAWTEPVDADPPVTAEPSALDTYVLDAFTCEGIRFAVADDYYEAKLADGWLAIVGRDHGPLGADDGWSLGLWHPTLGVGAAALTLRELDTGDARAGVPLEYVAAKWGPLLRTLDGYAAMLLSQGVGGLWRVKVTHPDYVLDDRFYVVRALRSADAEGLAAQEFWREHSADGDDLERASADHLALWPGSA